MKILIIMTFLSFIVSCKQHSTLVGKKNVNQEIRLYPFIHGYSFLGDLNVFNIFVNKNRNSVSLNDGEFISNNISVSSSNNLYRDPIISDFCQQSSGSLIKNKISIYEESEFDLFIDVYSFVGQCDNVQVKCSMAYFTDSNNNQNQFWNEYSIYQNNHVALAIFGINGQYENCEKFSDVVYKLGCTDDQASNYDELAIEEDGSCVF